MSYSLVKTRYIQFDLPDSDIRSRKLGRFENIHVNGRYAENTEADDHVFIPLQLDGKLCPRCSIANIILVS